MIFRIHILFMLLLCIGESAGQNRIIDSLNLAYKNARHDTIRCRILNAMIEAESDDAKWPEYNQKLLELAESNLKAIDRSSKMYLTFLKYYASSINNKGYLENVRGNIPEALVHFQKSLKLFQEVGDEKIIASIFNSLGASYKYQGDIQNALKYYGEGLKLKEKIGDKKGVALVLNNLSILYKEQGDYDKAAEYCKRSLDINTQLNDKRGIALSLNNYGSVISKKGNNTEALKNYLESLPLWQEIKDEQGRAYTLNNIGGIYEEQGDFPSALESFTQSYEIHKKFGYKKGIAHSLYDIGYVYFKQKKYKQALEYCSKSLEISKEINFPESIKEAAEALAGIYKASGQDQLALQNFELYILMRDSINNESTRKASIKQQLRHEYETKAAADSVAHVKESEIKNAELAKQKAEIKAKKNQQYALFGGLFAVCVFGVFMFNRYKVTQKQKSIIEQQKQVVEEQKKLVEEKQTEILDSIRYAKRIQMAQIPGEKQVNNLIDRLRNKHL